MIFIFIIFPLLLKTIGRVVNKLILYIKIHKVMFYLNVLNKGIGIYMFGRK